MSDLTLENFLKEVGLRLCAAVVVVGTFVGLGYVTRTDVLGLSGLIDTPGTFFTVAFLLVGIASLGWVAVQRWRA